MKKNKFICLVWADEESFYDPAVFTTKEKAEAWGKKMVEELDALRYTIEDY